MARFGIVSALPALGVQVGDVRAVAKAAGKDHALALDLWANGGCYEARLLACFVAERAKVTPGLMDEWAAEFDNWAICDTACFDLFDLTPHAPAKVCQWAADEREFVRRAAFALLASVALHAKKLPDDEIRALMPLIEVADDNRNFVRKGVSWALRAIGGRRAGLHAESVAMAERMAASASTAKRWVGKDAIRDLNRPLVRARLGL